MSKLLSDLDPIFLPIAQSLIQKCAEAGVPIAVIETRRTEAEHQAQVAKGLSWTKHSLHQDGLAIDVCPKELLSIPRWRPEPPLWDTVGEIGERLGLRWGGRWKQKDLGHFEMQRVFPAGTPTAMEEA